MRRRTIERERHEKEQTIINTKPVEEKPEPGVCTHCGKKICDKCNKAFDVRGYGTHRGSCKG